MKMQAFSRFVTIGVSLIGLNFLQNVAIAPEPAHAQVSCATREVARELERYALSVVQNQFEFYAPLALDADIIRCQNQGGRRQIDAVLTWRGPLQNWYYEAELELERASNGCWSNRLVNFNESLNAHLRENAIGLKILTGGQNKAESCVGTTATTQATGLRFCNKTDQSLWLAFSYNDNGIWATKGWRQIDPDNCATAISSALTRSTYYYYATSEDGGEWKGSHQFCLHRREAFDLSYAETECISPNQWQGFRAVETNGKRALTLNLTD